MIVFKVSSLVLLVSVVLRDPVLRGFPELSGSPATLQPCSQSIAFHGLYASRYQGAIWGEGISSQWRSASYGEVMNVIQSLKDKAEKHFLNIEWQENPHGSRISNTELRIKNIKSGQCGVSPLSCNLNYLNGLVSAFSSPSSIPYYQLRNKIHYLVACVLLA